MATLQSSSATSLSVSGSSVWTTANSGATGGIDAGKLAGYDITKFNVHERLTFLDLRGTSGSTNYNLNTWYPMVIEGRQTANGVTELDIRRTSVHQDGGGYGAFFGTFRYRAGGYNFWEINENWGSGSYYPFFANGAVATNDRAAIWLRGGLSYYYKFNNDDAFIDTTSNNSKSFGSTTVSSTTTVSLPSSARFLQHSICSQGYDLGASSFRWGTVFTVNPINASSDSKFKDDQKDLTFGLNFVKKLQPKSYTLKEHPHMTDEIKQNIDTRRQHGLVAQDVMKSMEELGISKDDFAGLNIEDPRHYSLRYDQFIPVVVKAIQEQFNDLDAIDARIKRLEERV